LLAVKIKSDIFNFRRVGQVINHTIEQGLNSLVAVGRADKNRGKFPPDRGLPDGLADELRRSFIFEQSLGQLVRG